MSKSFSFHSEDRQEILSKFLDVNSKSSGTFTPQLENNTTDASLSVISTGDWYRVGYNMYCHLEFYLSPRNTSGTKTMLFDGVKINSLPVHPDLSQPIIYRQFVYIHKPLLDVYNSTTNLYTIEETKDAGHLEVLYRVDFFSSLSSDFIPIKYSFRIDETNTWQGGTLSTPHNTHGKFGGDINASEQKIILDVQYTVR